MTIAKVMIVDDDEDVRTVTALAARRIGNWEVIAVGSGAEALVQARTEQPDVILLDVMMPDLDGPATLMRLREDPSTERIPVVFLTAKAQKHEVERYKALGATGVILKPFDVMSFADEVRRVVEGG